jgi:hypothetical protein
MTPGAKQTLQRAAAVANRSVNRLRAGERPGQCG